MMVGIVEEIDKQCTLMFFTLLQLNFIVICLTHQKHGGLEGWRRPPLVTCLISP